METLNNNSLVSIVIPTYNYVNYLAKALELSITQSYKNFEIIIIDDGSIDNTEALYRTSMTAGFPITINKIKKHFRSARNRSRKEILLHFLMQTIISRTVQLSNTFTRNAFKQCCRFCDKLSLLNCSSEFNIHKDTISNRLCEELLLKRLPYTTSAYNNQNKTCQEVPIPIGLSNGKDLVYFCKSIF